MKTVVNKTARPLRVPLPKGKTLFLGPLKSGEIATHAEEHGPLKELIEAGQIEIFDATKASTGHGQGPNPHTSHPAQEFREVQQMNKGDR